jgi:hypothetical protein
MDKFKDPTSSDVKFQGNDYLPSEITQNKEIIDDCCIEGKADRSIRKLRKSQKDSNTVNSGD